MATIPLPLVNGFKCLGHRAGPRLRPIRPLPRAPILEKAPNLGAIFNFYFLYINIFRRYKNILVYIFFTIKKAQRSNVRDRDKTNLNK